MDGYRVSVAFQHVIPPSALEQHQNSRAEGALNSSKTFF
jgi:hypothetical protein